MLQVTPEFSNDTQSKDINVIPLVKIVKGDFTLRLSTNNISLPDSDGGSSFHYKPLITSIPGIKESVDFDSRRYKISSLAISASNFKYENERLSDITTNLINADVTIYWKSQSCDTLGKCLKVFEGKMRRVNHSSDNFTFQVEDISQANLHKDLPISILPDDDSVPDKYKNKPIPMVYGHVDKSPCVVKSSISNDEESISKLTLLADNTIIQEFLYGNYWYKKGLYKLATDPLWVSRGESYFNIIQTPRSYGGLTLTEDNYILDENTSSIVIEPKYATGGTDGVGLNAPAFDLIDVNCLRIPQNVNILEWEDYEIHTLDNAINLIKHTLESSFFSFSGYMYVYPLGLKPRWESISDDDLYYLKTYSLLNLKGEFIESGNAAYTMDFKTYYDETQINYLSTPADALNRYETFATNNLHNVEYEDDVATYVENHSLEELDLYLSHIKISNI